MNRLLYERSVSYNGHLIVPFVLGKVDGKAIYSYKLLSELGHQGKFHHAENPAGMCSNSIESITQIAKEHLDVDSDVTSEKDYFKRRYTYIYNLIIIHGEAGKYFYDHYKPENLNNIAASKIFQSEWECIRWVKQGLDRTRITPESRQA